MSTDTGPNLGLAPGACRTLADVDDAIIRLNARRIWIAARGAGDSDKVWRSLANAYLDRRLTLDTAAMVKA